jgi:hypothetical protein
MTIDSLLAYASSPAGQPATMRWRCVLVPGIIVGGVVDGLAILSLWFAWDSSQWVIYWATIAVGFTLLFMSIILPFRSERQGNKAFAFSSRQLRDILAQPADRTMPVAEFQPDSPEKNEPNASFGPFHCPYDPAATSIAMLFAGLMFAIVPLLFPLFETAMLFQWSESTVIAIVIVLISEMCVALLALIVWTIRIMSRRFSIATTDQGLVWTVRKHEHHMAWDEARAVLQIIIQGSGSSRSANVTYYVVVGAQTTLYWYVSSSSPVALRAQSERLLNAIVARTALPLRDASLFAARLSNSGKDVWRFLAYSGVPAVLATAPTTEARGNPFTRGLARTLGIGVLALCLLCPIVVGIWGQNANASYIAALSQRVAARPPLFADTFLTNTGAWPQTPTSYTFGSSYRLHDPANTNQEVAWLNDRSFGVAAYTLTAIERGPVPDGESDGIGLAFRGSADQTDYLVFDVKYDGEWGLWHYHPHTQYGPDYLDSGRSAAIVQGPDQANQLMVIPYSQGVFLYVNGQLVGIHALQTPPSGDPIVNYAQPGGVGLYLSSAAMTGDFTSFAVYPAPPFDFWDAVPPLAPWH